jgi:hypothetical protein
MKRFLKYMLGPAILLIGTALLAIYFFNNTPENTILIVAGALMITGLVAHVVINRFVEE